MENQVSMFDHDSWCGKTSPAHSVVQAVKISAPSSKKLPKLPTRPPLFLDLRGGWTGAGCIMGDGWSIAWRVLDAQFWGVPQRRRRIALVADFGGSTAPEILFERPGETGDTAQSRTQRKETSGTAKDGVECIPINLQIATRHNALGEGTGMEIGEERQSAYTLQANHSHGVEVGMNQNASGEVRTSDKAYSLSTNSNPSGRNAPLCIQGSMIGRADKNGPQGDGINEDVSFTLNATDRHAVAAFDERQITSPENRSSVDTENPCPSLNTRGSMSVLYPDIARSLTARADSSPCVDRGQNVVVVKTAQTGSNGANVSEGDVAYTLDGANDQTVAINIDENTNTFVEKAGTLQAHSGGGAKNYVSTFSYQALGQYEQNEVCASLRARNDTSSETLVYSRQSIGEYKQNNATGTLDASNDIINKNLIQENFVIRRLTPLECTRLQGYPDDWLDIGGASDTQKYTALGNSIALPPWRYVCRRVCEQIGRRATLGSLFDGIGGFPLIWEEINGKGSAVWGSEINPFCIRVTKERFGEG